MGVRSEGAELQRSLDRPEVGLDLCLERRPAGLPGQGTRDPMGQAVQRHGLPSDMPSVTGSRDDSAIR